MRRMYEGVLPINKERLRRVSKLYAEVFAGPPWREASRCSSCNEFSGNSPAEKLPCKNAGCTGTYSLEAYPLEETTQSIRSELSKPLASGIQYVRMEDVRQTIEEVFAFGWGYASDNKEFGRNKYQTAEMRTILSKLLVQAGAFYYVSEVGVAPSKQGQGVGKDITERLATFGKDQLGTVVLRTNEESPMRYIAQNLGMKPILGLKTGLKDLENEKRVVFVGGAYGRQ